MIFIGSRLAHFLLCLIVRLGCFLYRKSFLCSERQIIFVVFVRTPQIFTKIYPCISIFYSPMVLVILKYRVANEVQLGLAIFVTFFIGLSADFFTFYLVQKRYLEIKFITCSPITNKLKKTVLQISCIFTQHGERCHIYVNILFQLMG